MTKQSPTLYECMYILVPTLEENEIAEVARVIEQAIQEADGEVKGHYDWGRRRFAYKIRQWTEGIYRIVYFTSMGPAVDELKRLATSDERIIRAMVVIADPRAIYRPAEEGAEEEPAAEEAEEPAEAGGDETQAESGQPEPAEASAGDQQ